MPVDTSSEVPFGHLAREMSRFIDKLGKNYSNFYPGESWAPNVNLYEKANAYLVCVDLAGVDKEGIDLQVVEQRLILRGKRDVPPCPADIDQPERGQAKARIDLMEIDHGPFYREVELPPNIVADAIRASYRNGLLWVEIPKLA